MKIKYSFKTNYAVTEVVGGLFLIVIAILSFTVLRFYLFPDLSAPSERIEMQGYVTDDGYIIIEHIGGKSISNCKVVISDQNGTYVDSIEYENWNIGICKSPLEDINYSPLLNESDEVEISVYNIRDDSREQLVFIGVFSAPSGNIYPNQPILISTLRTDSVDEDLICYSYPIVPNIIAKTYIYHWMVNKVSIEDLNMPFDTENNVTCKDYSGKDLNGTLVGVVWTDDGVVGGGYFFGGSSEYITLNVPPVFLDIPNNDFSVSLWVKSNDITRPHSVILMASANNKNFIKFFINDYKIHFGVSCEGIKDAGCTGNLSSNTWYHIVGVWRATEKKIIVYCNGVEYTNPGYRQYSMGSGEYLLEMGHGSTSSQFFYGYLDELVVYNRALSASQAFQIYLSAKDGQYFRRVFTSDEVKIGEKWQCIVTPNDSVGDDVSLFSNIVKIIRYGGGG